MHQKARQYWRALIIRYIRKCSWECKMAGAKSGLSFGWEQIEFLKDKDCAYDIMSHYGVENYFVVLF